MSPVSVSSPEQNSTISGRPDAVGLRWQVRLLRGPVGRWTRKAWERSVNWEDCLQHAEVSDIGLRRTTNQDSYAVVLASDMEAWQRSGHLFVVADGMGAHAAGELASEMAVSGIAHRYHKYHDLSPPEALHRAIQETNAEVHQRGQANRRLPQHGHDHQRAGAAPPRRAGGARGRQPRLPRPRQGAGTTDVRPQPGVGTARARPVRSQHSDFASVVPKNIITRSLGPNPTVQTDFEGPFPLELGDTFLLCSDGLTGLVQDDEIGPILASLPPRRIGPGLDRPGESARRPRQHHGAGRARHRPVPDDAWLQQRAADDPARPTRTKKSQPVLWIVASVCLLAALAMAVVEQTLPALVALAGGLIAVLAAIVRRWTVAPRGIPLGETRRLGRGPHVRIECPVNAEFVGRLAALTDQLRSATEGAELESRPRAGSTSCAVRPNRPRAKAQFEEALKHYVHAISYMMAELREQHRRTRQGPDLIRAADAENPLQAIPRQDAITAAALSNVRNRSRM